MFDSTTRHTQGNTTMLKLNQQQRDTVNLLANQMMVANNTPGQAGHNQDYGLYYDTLHTFLTRIIGQDSKQLDWNWQGNPEYADDVQACIDNLEPEVSTEPRFSLTHDEAMDSDATTTVDAATREIESHGHSAKVEPGVALLNLLGMSEWSTEWEPITPVFAGSVSTRAVMQWLGY